MNTHDAFDAYKNIIPPGSKGIDDMHDQFYHYLVWHGFWT